MFRLPFHLACAAIVFYAIATNGNFTWYGTFHNLQILTLWNLWILFLFFVASVFFDLIFLVSKASPRLFRSILSDAFNAIVSPLSLFVTIIFVGVYLFDGDVPKDWFTNIRNQIAHTTPTVLVIAERCIIYHPYVNIGAHAIGIALLTFLYQVTVLTLRTTRGSWIYLFLDSYKMNSRIIFFLTMLPIMCLMYFTGSQFNHKLWRARKIRRSSSSRA